MLPLELALLSGESQQISSLIFSQKSKKERKKKRDFRMLTTLLVNGTLRVKLESILKSC